MKENNIYLDWTNRGDDDIAFAKFALKEGGFYQYVCLLSQQAVEKYLKAFLIKRKGALAPKLKTHNLIFLMNECEGFGLDLSAYEGDLRYLDGLYVPSRYPVHQDIKFGKKEGNEALKIAQEIIAKISKTFE